MASQAQIEANRQNAQKSTGPRTPEGKAKSSQNALTHGLTATGESLLPHEAQSSYYRFHQEMFESLHPGSPLENLLVRRITDLHNRLGQVIDQNLALKCQLEKLQQPQPAPVQNKANSPLTAAPTAPCNTPPAQLATQHSLLSTSPTLPPYASVPISISCNPLPAGTIG